MGQLYNEMNEKELITQHHRFTTNDLEEARRVFDRDGVVFFDSLLPKTIFKEAEDKINEKLSEYTNVKDLHNLRCVEKWFSNFVTRSEFTDIAKILLDVKSVKVFTSMVVNKPSYSGMEVPWHQDAAYDWPIEPKDCATLWLAFDDVTIENGAMEVAIGSHKDGIFTMEDTEVSKEDKPLFINRVTRAIPEEVLSQYKKNPSDYE